MTHGKQVNFFLETKDWDKIERYLNQKYFLILAEQSPNEKPVLLSDLALDNEDLLIKYLVLSEHLPHVKMKYLSNKQKFLIDQSFSPVIELQTCLTDEDSIFRGRFFYNPTFLNPQSKEFEKHNDLFLKAAQNLISWFKKNHLPLTNKGFYTSSSAQKKKFVW